MHDILFDPPLPPMPIIALGLLIAGLCLAVYGRFLSRNAGAFLRAGLGAVRVAVLAALVVLLMRPMRELPRPVAAGKPLFTVLVDTSASMNTRDIGSETRFAVAQRILKDGETSFLRELSKTYEVKLCTFDSDVRRTEFGLGGVLPPAAGMRTDLAKALVETGTSEPGRSQGGILMLSDGRDNAGGNVMGAATFLKTRQVPVWTTCLGTPVDVKDVYVLARLNQSFMFAQQPGTLHVTVSQSGYPQWHANVHLYREDKYVATRQAVFSSGSVQLDFPLTEDRKGLYRYHVAVDTLPGEGDTNNNARTVFVRVVDDKTKVLLVEARPYWDSKFLLRTLHEDPNITVTTVFCISPTKTFGIREKLSGETLEKESSEGPPEMPRTRAELYKYDCLVLGKGVDELLAPDQMQMVKDYVTDRGGSIVFFRGRSYSGTNELAGLEPVVWADDTVRDARLDLTPEGQNSPVFAFGGAQPADVLIRSMPPMLSITKVKQTKSLAVVLAVGRESGATQEVAAVSYQRYGKGKVMSIGASGLWRWAFLPAEMDEFKDVYRLFWAQVVRWLVSESEFLPGQDVSFRTGGYTYQPGQTVRFFVGVKNVDLAAYRPAITIYPPAGKPAMLTPQPMSDQAADFAGAWAPTDEGEYRAVLRSNIGVPRELETRFTVYSDMEEKRFVAADPALMFDLARCTGGEHLKADQLDKLPARVKALAMRGAPGRESVDIWDRVPVFLLLTLALVVEWFLRRRAGLV